jgi:hypothetical protein
MDRANCNAIVILDAIPIGEFNTVGRLQEDIETYAGALAPGFRVIYLRLNTLIDLQKGMAEVLDLARTEELRPILHLEGHGLNNASGFAVADGSACTWLQFKPYVTEINIATKLNLFLVCATCYGGAFAQVLEITDRAPLWGLLGPKEEISAGYIFDGFQAFYKKFFLESDSSKAFSVLAGTALDRAYFLTNAKWWFYEVWAGYKDSACCSEAELILRGSVIQRQVRQNYGLEVDGYDLLRKFEEPILNRFRDKYFMYDLYPENIKRFEVTYSEAERHRKSYHGHGSKTPGMARN